MLKSRTSLKNTSAGVRLDGISVLFFFRADRMAVFTSSGCLAWWFFSTMAAESFSACSHSKSRVAIGDERTVVEVRRSRRPVCRADREKRHCWMLCEGWVESHRLCGYWGTWSRKSMRQRWAFILSSNWCSRISDVSVNPAPSTGQNTQSWTN